MAGGTWAGTAPVTLAYQWQSCPRGRERLVNAALRHPVRASRSFGANPPALGVDGDYTSWWGSGDFGRQWIEVDLGAPTPIAALRLVTSQTPAGRTGHRVWGRNRQRVRVSPRRVRRHDRRRPGAAARPPIRAGGAVRPRRDDPQPVLGVVAGGRGPDALPRHSGQHRRVVFPARSRHRRDDPRRRPGVERCRHRCGRFAGDGSRSRVHRAAGDRERTLRVAGATLRRHGCRLGRVTHTASARPEGRVVRQALRAGARLTFGARVAVVVSKG